MERRPAPEVTIEGGPGWQLGETRDEVHGQDEPDEGPRGPWLPTSGWRGLALAAVVGFAVATALAQARLTTLRESDDGVLSLEVREERVDYGRSVQLAGPDGGPALSTTVVLRNTGPRPVALERVELVGTPYRSDDLAGRRLADGEQTTVTLLRPVDCDAVGPTPDVGPLRVRGTTGAGSRTVDLRMSPEVVAAHDDQVRRSCGQAPPGEALVVVERVPQVDGDRAVVTAELSNASSQEIAVLSVRPREGLRLARTLDGAGAPVALPLALPPGDYDPPVDPYVGRGESRVLVLELEVVDCAALAEGDGEDPQEGYRPLVEVMVGGDVPAPNGWGGDPNVVGRLRRAACSPSSSALPAPLTPQEVAAEVYRSAD